MGCSVHRNKTDAVSTRQLFFLLIITLCILDILSTKYVITEGVGYESNHLIAPLISTPFFIFKLLLTPLILLGIRELCRKQEKLEITSYLTITMFYTVVVLNNLAVILAQTDLQLNTQKLLIIFTLLYVISTPLSTKLNSGKQ